MEGGVVRVRTAERGFLMRNRSYLPVALTMVLALLVTSCGGPASEACVETSIRGEEITAECMTDRGLGYTVWLPPEDLPPSA
jgi:hypothetical protein